MLFVFHVDLGNMMTFDMSLALESVNHLKEEVQKTTKIPAEKQVLLISGGECLDPSARLCSYAAGTDTNPIFLFSKTIIESTTPPQPQNESDTQDDTMKSIQEALAMSVSRNTVLKRAQLAQKLHDTAKEQILCCERLVHDQHLQQQGWSAVVANLEDITAEFQKRAEIFSSLCKDYMTERDTYLQFLQHFNDDLVILQKIPILSTLIESEKVTNSEIESSKEEAETQTSQTEESSCSEMKDITLLEWISAADNKSSMDHLYDHCARGLEQFDDKVVTGLKQEVDDLLHSADNNQMKEVKGLGDRLSGLETLMREAKKYVQEQSDLAQAFMKNQNRMANVKDTSILPDLCESHVKQLEQMTFNYRQLCDIKRRCSKAKEELSTNLFHRLKWVMYIENRIVHLDQSLVIYHENLRRLRRHLDVLQQIHLAPATYLCAVAEVVRRRSFSQSFLLWASELACHLLTIHNDEITRRKEFQSQFEGHFLNSLFPGMDDLPPSFATQAPSVFDSRLPKISQEDIDRLKDQLPDYAESLHIPDLSAITNFFMIKSIIKSDLEKVDDTKAVEDKLVQVVSEVGLGSNLDHNLLRATGSEQFLPTAHGLPHLKDLDRGCESETDTEEFEKVGQSPLELNFDKDIPSPRPGTQDASTCTEVGDRFPIPPKKPPRTFQKAPTLTHSSDDLMQRTLSISSTQSNTESFTNIKNPSLDSIDEMSSIKNFTSNVESNYNSHHQQMQNNTGKNKSLSPQSPKDEFLSSPQPGHQQGFLEEEFYIDESLPSSMSNGTGQSQGEFVKQLDTANNVVAMLQDNLQISRSEHEKLKSYLIKVSNLARQAIGQLKTELNDLRIQYIQEKSIIESGYKSLTTSCENLVIERDKKEKALIESIRNDHEVVLENINKVIAEKETELSNLKVANVILDQKYQKTTDELTLLRSEFSKLREENTKNIENHHKQMVEKDAERERAVKEAVDRITREHKAELESIRSRFKLMTMERSPSDSSLEKIADFSNIPNHESILLQMTETFELDKERAVKEAVDREAEKWQKIMDERVKEITVNFNEDKQNLIEDVAKRVTEEKDKQIDVLREREKNLNLECIKYKSTIQQLAECEAESQNTDLLEKIDTLEREKKILEEEFERMKRVKVEERQERPSNEMIASVAVIEGQSQSKIDATTSPIRIKESSTKSEISSSISALPCRKISIDTCKPGDNVLVLWDELHSNFKIAQEAKHMYFLHSDYLENLGLEVSEGKPNKRQCPGVVVDKEYCHARKSENRYKVPKGTKFFRVKVKPFSVLQCQEITQSQSVYYPSTRSAALIQSHMSQSQTVAPTFISEETNTTFSLPSSPTRTTMLDKITESIMARNTVTEISEETETCDQTGPESPKMMDKSEVTECVIPENPEEIKPSSVEKSFYTDSGVVEGPIDEAHVAIDNLRDNTDHSKDPNNLRDNNDTDDADNIENKITTSTSTEQDGDDRKEKDLETIYPQEIFWQRFGELHCFIRKIKDYREKRLAKRKMF